MALVGARLFRKHSQRCLSSKQLMYEKYGHPPDVGIFFLLYLFFEMFK